MKKSFLIYEDYEKYFDMLSPEEQSKLIKALFKTFKSEDTTNIINSMEGMTKMAFAFMETQLNEDVKKYKEKCEKNRSNINARYQSNTTEYNRIQPNTTDNDRIRPKQDKDKDLDKDLNNNIVVDDIQSTNITHARACKGTTTSTTLQDLDELRSICKGISIDCLVDPYKYDFPLLVKKVKESRYLKLFRTLSDLLNKYDYIIADKYKDFVIDRYISQHSDCKEAKKREYTKEEYEAIFDDVWSIEI